MSLTCFDRNPKNLSIFMGTCLSAAVEKDVNVGVSICVRNNNIKRNSLGFHLHLFNTN